jgi:FtsP/CotA-like multicopper oxidase with cupredoxin domain
MQTFNRREFLKYSGAGGALLLSGISPFPLPANAKSPIVKGIDLTAAVTSTDLGSGKPFQAWTYNGQAPSPEIRVSEGDMLRVTLHNNLPEETTIHWHGVPVPNAMDGVPDITQKPVKPGETFVYEFIASPPGTYIYHSHVSYQLDQGLYAALIIEPRYEELSYDLDYTVMLEDWAMVDGGGPEASRKGQSRSGGMGGMMGGGGMGGMMGGGMGGMMGRRQRKNDPLLEPRYDAYAVNGRIFNATQPFMVRKGDKIRLRFINPSSSTIYTIRVAGHSLTVTHTDGRPVNPFEVDALRIGMAERYDVLLKANNPGRWLIYNLQDRSAVGGIPLGVLAYRGITSKSFDSDTLSRFRLNDYNMMDGLEEEHVNQVGGRIDKIFRMTLSGGMMGSPYWTINGKIYPDSDDVRIRPGDKVRFEYFNHSMMPHPMHLHGHFFEIEGTGKRTGVRVKKDTLIIPAHMGRGAIEFVADNPGVWFHHCHNLYHLNGGMANLVRNTG